MLSPLGLFHVMLLSVLPHPAFYQVSFSLLFFFLLPLSISPFSSLCYEIERWIGVVGLQRYVCDE